MGQAKILKNLGGGQYSVQIIKETEKIETAISNAEKNIKTLDVSIEKKEEEILIADLDFADAEKELDRLVSKYKKKEVDQSEVTTQTTKVIEAGKKKNVLILEYNELVTSRYVIDREIFNLKNILKIANSDIRDVWAVDYYPNISVNTVVGTYEINGETDIIRIGPVQGKVKKDLLGMTRVLDADKWFSMQSLKPGNQKWAPTTRVGYIETIDYEKGTCTIKLEKAISKVKREALS